MAELRQSCLETLLPAPQRFDELFGLKDKLLEYCSTQSKSDDAQQRLTLANLQVSAQDS